MTLANGRRLTFFDRPITRLQDLYGRGHRDAVEKLSDAVRSKTFAAVTGPRRIGKTSVVKTCLKESKFKYLLFDLSPYMGRRAVSFRVLSPTEIGLENSKISAEVQANLALINISFKRENAIEGDVFQSNMISLLRELDKKFRNFCFVVDEAQVLAFMKGLDAGGLLQLIHNNYTNTSVILTGSMPGMLLKILRPTDATEPSFARYVEIIELPRWSNEESASFLRLGLHSSSIRFIESDIAETIESFSGTPGFLSYYGIMRTRGKTHARAYDETISFAVSEWKKDVKAFVAIYDSPNYIKALKISAATITGMSAVELEGELKVSKPTAYRLIENLVGAGMLLQSGSENKYVVADPTLKIAIQGL